MAYTNESETYKIHKCEFERFNMFNLRSIMILFVTLCICYTFAACKTQSLNSSLGQSSVIDSPNATTDPLDEIMSEDEQAQIKSIIDDIRPEYNYALSGVMYNEYKECSDRLVAVGIKGIPVMLTELETLEIMENSAELLLEQFYKRMFLAEGINAILRTRSISMVSVAYDSNCESCHPYNKECISTFYRYANEETPKILVSNEDISIKLEKLRHFGLLAVPHIIEAIENGNTEYEVFFIEIGLQLSVPEFMEFFGDGNASENQILEKIRNTGNPEEFDYKVWLEENREDLDAMFKYLEAYAASE